MASKQDSVLTLFCADEHSPAIPTGSDASVPLAGYAFLPSSATVPEVDIFPSGIGHLQKGHQFSIFKKSHAEEAATVVNYLLSLDSFQKFKEDSARLRPILNEGIYLYAVSTAVLHRKDTDGALLPPIWEVNPRSYFPGTIIKRALDLARNRRDKDDSSPPPAFITGNYRDPEFKLAWWREDCSFNSHHFHWHQSYPWTGIEGKTKDRQGELFYYMHQQMLARYDAERIAVGLTRVEPFCNWHLPIAEGYNPQLTDYYGTYQFAARPAGMILADNWRDPSDPTLIIQQEYHRNRLLDAINTGKFEKPDGSKVAVDIDGLGAAIEANVSTPNPHLYGSVGIHNRGHDILAGITDPDLRYNQAGGVMGDTAAAIRDPMFFRWHKFVDDLFFLHKIKLTPYTEAELSFEKVKVDSVKLQIGGKNMVRDRSKSVKLYFDFCVTELNCTFLKMTGPADILTTRMENVEVDIANDMFLRQGDKPNTEAKVTVKQVNHDNFNYKIGVENKRGRNMRVAVRIFMAPSSDAEGAQFLLDTQRRLFIEMDKFVTTLEKNGMNTITRSSADSSVIKPRELTIAELRKRVLQKSEVQDKDCCRPDRYCECGWPEHMLVPRGTAEGMKFDLFVMVTDWASDSSTDDLDRGTSYCGVKDKKYPDKRAMGFPFDRKIDKSLYKSVFDFARGFPNMKCVPINIKWVSGP
ncbi:hemocyanin AA6 chain-like [Acanthaster planci]|uniref:Hemocyanin AA6 chain-like n=1 Tax=Acanthaster planci TaxID=133434 RepID=A0A8B8A1G4_ACAPL|nr:hemocyanin AA6 chain-like [Acanthaster planci]